MNKNVFLVIIAILVIVIGGYFLLNQDNPQTPASSEKAGTEGINIGVGELQETNGSMEEENKIADDNVEDDKMTQPEADAVDDSTSRAGTYEAYDPAKLAMASDGNVVLFFHAGWCPTCKFADRDINAHLSDIPDNVHILKTDYDTERELKKKYGVTYQHTFVQVDAQGNQIKKWSGSNTLSAILSQIQ